MNTLEEITKKLEEAKEAKEKIQRVIDRLEEVIDEQFFNDKKNPFERRDYYEDYYAIDMSGNVVRIKDSDSVKNNRCYDIGNYCADENIMRKRAALEILFRLIWREAEIANAKKEEPSRWYSIIYDDENKEFTVCEVSKLFRPPYDILFADSYDALSCIRDVVNPFVKKHFKLGYEVKD